MKYLGTAIFAGGVAGSSILLGLGSAASLATMTALFCVGSAAGSLRLDLRTLMGMAPAMFFVVAAPRVLGEYSHALEIVLLVSIMFGVGFLPALGVRFSIVPLGLGMASLFGYGLQLTGAVTVWQAIAAAPVGIAAAAIYRVVTGWRDPGRPMRYLLADALVSSDPESLPRVAQLALADTPTRWITAVLAGTLRYRTALTALEDRPPTALSSASDIQPFLRSAKAEAARLADLIRGRDDVGVRAAVSVAQIENVGFTDDRYLITAVRTGLEAVHTAAVERDQSTTEIPASMRRTAMLTRARAALTWQSIRFRHAVRLAVGMGTALLVAELRPGDPFTVVFLTATFMIMQPSFQDTVRKAGERITGSLVGAAALTVAVWTLPTSALPALGFAALLVGFAFMQTQPAVMNASMVLLTVGIGIAASDQPLSEALIKYIVVMAIAVAIGLFFGFASVPVLPKPTVPQRYEAAVRATQRLLHTASTVLSRPGSDRTKLSVQFQAAALSRQDLAESGPDVVAGTPRQQAAAARAAAQLSAISTSLIGLLVRQQVSTSAAAEVERLADSLSSGTVDSTEPDIAGCDVDVDERALLDPMASAAADLHLLRTDLYEPGIPVK